MTAAFDATEAGMRRIQDWLIDCVHALPHIVRTMQARGYPVGEISEYLYNGAGHPEMPEAYLKLWRVVIQLWGNDTNALAWLERKPPELQQWFQTILAEIPPGVENVEMTDGSHRIVTTQALAFAIENDCDLDD